MLDSARRNRGVQRTGRVVSYDITVTIERGDGDDRHLSTNWLRNPYGLCRWAEDNVGEAYHFHDRPLWYVCNNWSYGDVDDLPRDRFHRVVTDYHDRIRGLDEGYFHFGLSSFIQFVAPNFGRLPTDGFGRIEGAERLEGGDTIAIPMEHFGAPGFNVSARRADTMLGHYQAWFGELVEIAERVRDGEDVSITS